MVESVWMTLPDRIILDTAKELIQQERTVVNVRRLHSKLLYNFDAKAWDIIYGARKEAIEIDELVKFLHEYQVAYCYENRIQNDSQLLLREVIHV